VASLPLRTPRRQDV